VIARSRAVVHPGGRLAGLSCQPPLTLRQVLAEEPGTCALCLVGSAAGPLPGDDLALVLEVAPGARATLQAAGASIAQGRAGTCGPTEAGRWPARAAQPAGAGQPTRAAGSAGTDEADGQVAGADRAGGAITEATANAAGWAARLSLAAVVGEGAVLRADPGPLVVRPGGRVRATVGITLAAGAAVDWREIVVLQQARGDGPGGYPAAALGWDVTCAGRPLLRQVTDLTDPVRAAWPEMLAGGRVLASALLAGPGVCARTVVAGPMAVAQRLDGDAVLVTVLGDDAATALRQRDALCAEIARQE
jgi:urease accessory protein